MNISGIRAGLISPANSITPIQRPQEIQNRPQQDIGIGRQQLENFDTEVYTPSQQSKEGFVRQAGDIQTKGSLASAEAGGISRQQKDQILQQYKLFMGQSEKTADVRAAVRPMEDFEI